MKMESYLTPFFVENYNYLLIPKKIVMNSNAAHKMLINIKISIR